jgi:thioredoxin 1
VSRSPRIVELTDPAELDGRLAAGPVLLDLWAPWCAPCRMLAPVIDELAEDYADRIAVVAVNVDDAPAIAERYGVRSIPTLIYFPSPEESPRRITGVGDAARIRAALSLPA